MSDYKVVMMHGFSQEEMTRIMRGVKSVVEDPRAVAFCVTTENNAEMNVGDLIQEVSAEHEYMLKNAGSAPNAERQGENPS